MKDIYQGRNFIFESMANSMMEDKSKGKDKKAENKTTDEIIAVALNQVFSILINSKMENAKTVRGFQEVKNKILGTSNFGAFRQYLVTLLESLGAMDATQKEAYDNNINFIVEVLKKAESQLGDAKVFDSVKKGIVNKLLLNFESDLEERENQMRKTNPKIYDEAVKKGQILKEDSRSGDETSVEDAEFRGAVFNKSKESLDAATAFVGMVDRDQLVDVLKGKPELTKYKDIAANLYKEAQDLQLLDREGIAKVVTAIGTFRRNEYARKQDSLINEIIREKREYVRLKDAIQKSSSNGLVIPSIPDPVCPPGMTWDRTRQTCISAGKPEGGKTEGGSGKKKATPTPVVVKDCQFPIKVGSKCNQVGELQNKIIELVPSAKAYLNLKGGSDKIYGKATSLVTNIIWGYISNNKNIEMNSDLTQEKFDAVMKLTTNDVDLDLSGATPVRDSLEVSFRNKIEEKEDSFNTPILSFEKFSEILESNLEEAVMGEDGKLHKTGDMPEAKKIIKDSCVKKSIESGKIEDCFGIKPVPVRDDEKEKEKEKVDPTPPTREEWKGLKYVQTGTYPVVFDESMLSFWSKEIAIEAASLLLPGSGLLLKAGTTGARSLAIKGATKIGATKLAKKLAGKAAAKSIGARAGIAGSYMASIAARLSRTKLPGEIASQLSHISSGFFRRYKKIPIPKRLASGAIGGTFGAAALDFISGRDSYTIEIVEGFIDRNVILATAKGMVNTIDGYVSDDDLACIATVLSVIKGAWTLDMNDNPASAWKVLKNAYKGKEGESILDDINSISSKMGEVEGFPKMKSANPLSTLSEIDWDFALMEVKAFAQRLESNESKLSENLRKLPKDYISAFVNGEFIEYDEEGNIPGFNLDKEVKSTEAKAGKSSSDNITI